jgi:phage terminase small subunit
MPGRRPKPTQLKVLQGTFQKCRGNPKEPQPELGIPQAPEYLQGEARAEWDRVTVHLGNTRVLALQDRTLLAAFCATHGRFVEMLQAGQDISPGFLAQYRLLGEAFGLSPAARAKVHAGKAEEGKNEWAQFLNKKG